MLMYAHEKGANLHKSDYFAAAEGELDCLKYIVEHTNAPKTLPQRIKTIECLQYLMEKLGREVIVQGANNIWTAAVAHSVEYLRFVHDNKIPQPVHPFYTKLILQLAVWSVDVLTFILDVMKLSFSDKYPLATPSVKLNLEVMKFMVNRNLHTSSEAFQSPKSIENVINTATISKNIDILNFVWNLYPNKEGVDLKI